MSVIQAAAPDALAVVLEWHREYARAARALSDSLSLGGFDDLFVDAHKRQDEEIGTAKAFAALASTGDLRVMLVGMRVLAAKKVLLGSVRMFLANGCSHPELRAWATEIDQWETRWADALEARQPAAPGAN